MRGRILFFGGVIAFFSLSCEDPTALSVSKSFGNSDLVTASSDTFSVVMSTVQLDTIQTNSTGALLLGEYKDPILGSVVSSPYFQVGYDSSFTPGKYDVYDSIGLILPYQGKQFYGDTTQDVELSIHQLTHVLTPGGNLTTRDTKISIFNYNTGFYSQTVSPYNPTPIVTQRVKFRPHRDSIYIKLPKALGAHWFKLAGLSRADSGKYFSNSNLFINEFFNGLHIKINPLGGGSVAAFNPNKIKIRIFYEKTLYDIRHQVYRDFKLQNAYYQFQNISANRSGSGVDGIQARQAIGSSLTNHETFIQAGTGLVTRLDFPSLKNFFRDKKYIFNGAFLQIFPVQRSYSKSLPPPSPLLLYTTDETNVPTGAVTGATAAIRYDDEFGINTAYTFSLFSYVYSEIFNQNIAPTPLILAPASSALGNNVQRVVLGDQHHPANSKIKLIVYFSYASN